MTAFDEAFMFVVGSEGGYVNDPRDPGGETKYGISKRAFPNLDIARLTLDDAKTIYKTNYWNELRCDDLPPAVALVVFDAAVNAGVSASAKWLQAAVGAKQDGVVGPQTVAKARQAKTADLVIALLTQRNVHNAALRTWPVYANGWSSRLFRLAFQAARV